MRLNNGGGGFSGGSDPAVGSRPRWLALGDLDGDGDLDLLTANYGSNDASVRLNNGSGLFGGGTNLAAGTSPSSLVVADIDGDNDLDMLVSNFYSNNVTVWLNDGHGTFGSSSTLPVGVNPNGIATADVDNDGDLDLLAANFDGNTVSVRLGGGATALAAAPGAAAVEVALYPNPVRTQFTLIVNVPNGASGQAVLFNSLGQNVRHLQLASSGSPTTFNVLGLAKGVYTLRLQIGNSPIVKRVVIE